MDQSSAGPFSFHNMPSSEVSRYAHYLRVSIPATGYAEYTYRLSEMATVALGDRVRVPFGSRRVVGFVVGIDAKPHVGAKEMHAIVAPSSLLNPAFYTFCEWVASYYLSPISQVLLLAYPRASGSKNKVDYVWGIGSRSLPQDLLSTQFRPRPGGVISSLTRKRLEQQLKKSTAELERLKVIAMQEPGKTTSRFSLIAHARLSELSTPRKPAPQPFDADRTRAELTRLGWTNLQIAKGIERGILGPSAGFVDANRTETHVSSLVPAAPMAMNSAQTEVFQAMLSHGLDSFVTHLLQGVTGSGKTLVYTHLIQAMLALGKSVLILTPEIALAEGVARVMGLSFGESVVRWHSGLKERAKQEAWGRITSSDVPLIIIGPRSALFTPVQSLGLIIVDEEHDAAFKQAEQPPYFHARDAAIKRAQLANIPIVLGSATPSLESYYQATQGKYHRHLLTERATPAPLPAIRIVDMRTDRLGGELGLISATLKRAIDDRLSKHEQAILFFNRRGFSPVLSCESCGWSAKCEYCRQTLTYHRATGRLHCHFCGGTEAMPEKCPSCGHVPLEPEGHGTQRIESLLPRLFPSARLVRYDLDSTRQAEKAVATLRGFANGEADILLGTQMVTKGLDFPNVSLVGVLAADQGLHHIDFRASERTFARLVQVAGRSGRSEIPGEVIIQSYSPEHPLLPMVASHDYERFAETELLERRAQEFPPYRRVLRIVVSADRAPIAERTIGEIVARVKDWTALSSKSTILRGPAPCPLEFVRGEYRYHALVLTKNMSQLTSTLRTWLETDVRLGLPKNVRLRLDVDPVELQ